MPEHLIGPKHKKIFKQSMVQFGVWGSYCCRCFIYESYDQAFQSSHKWCISALHIQDKFGMNRQCTHLFCTSHIRPLWKSELFPQILINKQGIVWRGIRTHDRGLSVHCNTTLLSFVAVDAFPKTQFHTMRELTPRPLGPKPSALLWANDSQDCCLCLSIQSTV